MGYTGNVSDGMINSMLPMFVQSTSKTIKLLYGGRYIILPISQIYDITFEYCKYLSFEPLIITGTANELMRFNTFYEAFIGVEEYKDIFLPITEEEFYKLD